MNCIKIWDLLWRGIGVKLTIAIVPFIPMMPLVLMSAHSGATVPMSTWFCAGRKNTEYTENAGIPRTIPLRMRPRTKMMAGNSPLNQSTLQTPYIASQLRISPDEWSPQRTIYQDPPWSIMRICLWTATQEKKLLAPESSGWC